METPVCPDKRHKNSTVVRAGWYGREGQRRQRWWCQPKTGERHRFTETLPRISAGPGEAHSCAECQTTLQPWEGQPAPRLYGFSARDVAWALTQVAGGASYRGTAAAVRDRAGRPLEKRPGTASNGKTKLPPATQHGQLVSDWVDVFAPVIWSAYAPTTWPEAVLLDEDTFKHRLGDGSSAVAFYVLGAMARDDRGRSVVAAVEAVPKLSIAAWDRFLRSLEGQPSWVVTDGGGPVLKGASKAWPDARKWRCEWHLKRNLTDSLPSTVQRELTDPLHGKLAYAQLSEENWDAYRELLHRRSGSEPGFRAAETSAARLDGLIRAQAASRPDPSDGFPVSTGPLEQFFHTLELSLGDRAARLTNKRRADALLKLLAANRNGWVDHADWTAILRDHLDARRGHAAEQRKHVDSRSAPSLR